MVICGSCGRYLVHGHSQKKKSAKPYDYFRCMRNGVYKNNRCDNTGVIGETILLNEIERKIKMKIERL